ncbi:hypothetical protein F7D13_01465 [Methylocystis rosea]|uniref:SH3 domain-containing protein n=1 Tax=Methylocystis rosea TaxID=173366 RepID=A0ABX6EH75_9HYPH|nr:hypothetical protein [Methylocystis rosea]QGM92791.1 hypothetical protein F7D13_01465 [Methylocystis rosea]
MNLLLALSLLIVNCLTMSAAIADDWVAVHDAFKIEEVYFSVGGYPLTLSSLKIGAKIRSNRDINIREKPADWTRIKDVLKKDRVVTVTRIVSLSVPGGKGQLWAQIASGASPTSISNDFNQNERQSDEHASNAAPIFASSDVVRACEVLQTKLQRPKLRTERLVLGQYTDILSLPQTKSECTGTFDTGVPDIGSCTTRYDACGEMVNWGMLGKHCKPTTSTECSNAILCNAYKNYRKEMKCEIVFQLKLPDYMERPLSDFIDDGLNIVQGAQDQLAQALPAACVSTAIRTEAGSAPAGSLARAIVEILKRRVEERIRNEAEQWFAETAVATVAASIPSGGLGGAAALSTSLGTFVYRTHRALKPIMSLANDVNSYANDIGFDTSCGWSDWIEVPSP